MHQFQNAKQILQFSLTEKANYILLLLLLLEKTDLSCRMPKLQGQVTKSIKQYNNRLKKGNAVME